MQPENSALFEHLTAIRQQLAAVDERLAALEQGQKQLASLLGRHPERPAQPGDAARASRPAPAAPPQDTLAHCARDILRVLQQVGRPLTMLEILDELVQREANWRESTASHALVYLVDHGRVTASDETGPRRYRAVAAAEAAAVR